MQFCPLNLPPASFAVPSPRIFSTVIKHTCASLVAQMVKHPPANAGDAGDPGSISGSGISPGEGNGYLTPVFLP